VNPIAFARSVTGNHSTVASTMPPASAVKRAGVAPICNRVTSLASTLNWRRLERVRNSESEPNRLMANFFLSHL